MKERTIPHDVDIYVGQRVRRLRKGLGLTQEGLAGQIDITFQQLQKYERAANRISASKLYAISGALKCEIGDFFDGLPAAWDHQDGRSAPVDSMKPLMRHLPEIAPMAQDFLKLPEPLQRQISDLMATLAKDYGNQAKGSLDPVAGNRSSPGVDKRIVNSFAAETGAGENPQLCSA
jgi:transcriptional regulator with XRE-family HTH domain